MDIREFLDRVEKAVIDGMEKAEEGFKVMKEEIKEQLDKVEDKFERERKIKAIKESNQRRGRYSQAKRKQK